MSNLDGIDTGAVERPRDDDGLVDGVLMPNGMHPVAQDDIGDVQPLALISAVVISAVVISAVVTGRVVVNVFGCRCHRGFSVRSGRTMVGPPAIVSAKASAAEVMMSRFPAYASR